MVNDLIYNMRHELLSGGSEINLVECGESTGVVAPRLSVMP